MKNYVVLLYCRFIVFGCFYILNYMKVTLFNNNYSDNSNNIISGYYLLFIN